MSLRQPDNPDQIERAAALLWSMFHPWADEIPWDDVTEHPGGNLWRRMVQEVLTHAA